MKYFWLFWIHPSKVFNKIKDAKYDRQVLVIVILYVIAYIIAELYLPRQAKMTNGNIFLVENECLATFMSLILELLYPIVLSSILYIFLSIFKLRSSFRSIVLSLFFLKIIEIYIIFFNLLYFIILKDLANIKLLTSVQFLLEMSYLFVAIKNIARTNYLKTALIQVSSVGIIILVAFFCPFIKGDKLVNENRKDLQYFVNLGFKNAVDEIAFGINKNPSNKKLYYYMGEVYRDKVFFSRYKELSLEEKKILFKKAESFYRKALTIDNEYCDARVGLGRVYAAQEKYEDALKQFSIVIKKAPDNSFINEEIGEIYLKLNKTEMAKQFFKLSSKDEQKDIYFKKEYQIRTVDKIIVVKDKEINVESNIIWHIADPLLYQGKILSHSIAESRIKDIYRSVLRSAIMIKNYQEIPTVFGDEIERELINESNDTILRKQFGIEIKDIRLDIM